MATEALRRLADGLREQRFCPVLGSGASADLGIPAWRELIRRLGEESGLGEVDDAMAGRELPHVYDLLARSPERSERLRQALYGSCEAARDRASAPRTVRRRRQPPGEPAIHFLAVLACCNALSCERRQFHVITYNVDTCLEEEIAWLGHDAVAVVETRGNEKLRLSWKARRSAEPRVWSQQRRQFKRRMSVRVFHPHGVVLRHEKGEGLEVEVLKKDGWTRKQYSEDPVELGVIFGRKDYNQLFGSLNDPRNLPQLAAFLQFTCLFYGFSFSDPNVDRLLEVATDLRRPAEPDPDGAAPRHLALSRHPSRCQLGRPTRAGWSAAVDLEEREKQRLEQYGVETLHHVHYDQHKRFVVDLVRTVAKELGYFWPGSYAPPERRLAAS